MTEETMGPVARAIFGKLKEGLSTDEILIVDDSRHHKGHSGYREGGESHFRITVVSEQFRGLSRLARQRMVYGLLADELAGPVHALSVAAKTPDES